MNKILKDRVKLIRSMQDFANNHPWAIEIVSHVRKDVGQFLSLSQEVAGRVAYAAKIGDELSETRRRKTTISRYIRRNLGILPNNVSDRELFELQKFLFSTLTDPSINIVRGEAVKEAYRNAFGSESCMTGGGSRYVDLYAENPEKVGLVLYSNGGEARALLWDVDQGFTVLDRIYPDDKGTLHFGLRDWAVGQGYKIIRESREHCTVTLKTPRSGYFPYLDTFSRGKFLDGEKTVKLYNFSSDTCHMTFNRTDGGWEDDEDNEHYRCYGCDQRVDARSVIFVCDDPYCEECVEERFFYCNCCESYQDRDKEVTVYFRRKSKDRLGGQIEYWCRHCVRMRKESCCRCNKCGEYFLELNILYKNCRPAEGILLCEDCGGECGDCGAFFDREELIKLEGKEICKGCAAKRSQFELIEQ